MTQAKTLTISAPRAGSSGPMMVSLDGVPVSGVQRMKLGSIEGDGVLDPGELLIATIQVEVQIAGEVPRESEQIAAEARAAWKSVHPD